MQGNLFRGECLPAVSVARGVAELKVDLPSNNQVGALEGSRKQKLADIGLTIIEASCFKILYEDHGWLSCFAVVSDVQMRHTGRNS